MEQQPHNHGEEELKQTPETAESPEAQPIHEGIAEALRNGEPIDHETAWLIARSITPGSGALHQLAQTGEITPEIGGVLHQRFGRLDPERVGVSREKRR